MQAEFFAELFGISAQKIDGENSLFAAGSQQDMYDCAIAHMPSLQSPLGDCAICAKIEREMLQRCNPTALGAVKASLETLKQQGYRLAVLTNDMQSNTDLCLKNLMITELFDCVVSADSGHGRKPDTGGYQAICAAWNIPPADTVMVGDSGADVQVAQKAGAGMFIGVSEEFPRPTPPLVHVPLLIRSLEDLPEMLSG